jgi:hypothetical protein
VPHAFALAIVPALYRNAAATHISAMSRVVAIRSGTVATVLSAGLVLAGCLTDTRPRISEMYPDPREQLPAVTSQTVTQTETRTEVYTAPGTTLYYDSGDVRRTPSSRDPYWDQEYYRRYPDRRPVHREPWPPYEKVGTDRYYYPEGEVRCDNATGSCARWSGRQGRYVPDAQATQDVYGLRQRQRIHGDVPKGAKSRTSNN